MKFPASFGKVLRTVTVLALATTLSKGDNFRVVYTRFDIFGISNESNPAPSYLLFDLGEASGIQRLTNSGMVLFQGVDSTHPDGVSKRWRNGVPETLEGLSGLSASASDLNEDGVAVGYVNLPDRVSVRGQWYWHSLEVQSIPLGGTSAAKWPAGSSTPQLLNTPPKFDADLLYHWVYDGGGTRDLHVQGKLEDSHADVIDGNVIFGESTQAYVQTQITFPRDEIGTYYASLRNGYNLSTGSALSIRSLTDTWQLQGDPSVEVISSRNGVVWTRTNTAEVGIYQYSPSPTPIPENYLNSTLLTQQPIHLNDAGVLLAKQGSGWGTYKMIDVNQGTETTVQLPQPVNFTTRGNFIKVSNHRKIKSLDENNQLQEVVSPQYLGGTASSIYGPFSSPNIVWEQDPERPGLQGYAIKSVFPANTGFKFSYATHLNDKGLIACMGVQSYDIDGVPIPEANQKSHALLLVPFEMSSDFATIHPKYTGTPESPYICNNEHHHAPLFNEKIEGALTIYHNAVRDQNGVTIDFDVNLKAPKIGDITWEIATGPDSGTLVGANSETAIFRNPKKGGLYDFNLRVGGQKALGRCQLWLPVAGPDFSQYWESEIAYFKNTWGPAYRSKVNSRASFPGVNNISQQFVLKNSLILNDMNNIGSYLDWDDPLLGDETPCGGPSAETPGNRLTLYNYVISYSKRNNMLYALIGREMGISEQSILAGGNLVNYYKSKTWDTAEAKEAYRAGFDIYNGTGLQKTMQTRALKMHQPGAWDEREWPSHETTSGTLRRKADLMLKSLIQ